MTEVSVFQDNSVFFIEVDKVKPNPFQPRHEFDEAKLQDLAASIRMYGILQPLVVTRKEIETEEGGIAVEYQLIAGERRLRASKIAGLREVPALIRSREDDDRVKLELAIIENLQREDLNPVDRARSFQKLAEDFNLKHVEIAKKVGKSREYVSNTMRLLALPEEMLQALALGKISEGHTRPLLMLSDRPEEQGVLFKEILLKKMTVRDAEKISRKIAYDKVRKKERMFDPEIVEMETMVGEALGTRVHIEPKEVGGRIQIDYFNEKDLRNILEVLKRRQAEKVGDASAVSFDDVDGSNVSDASNMPEANEVETVAPTEIAQAEVSNDSVDLADEFPEEQPEEIFTDNEIAAPIETPEEAAQKGKEEEEKEDTYSLDNFSL